MEIKKTVIEMSFTEEEEKALVMVHNIFDKACDVREGIKGCRDCPFYGGNCPLDNSNPIQAMKNFIKKIAG